MKLLTGVLAITMADAKSWRNHKSIPTRRRVIGFGNDVIRKLLIGTTSLRHL
jgi:hypothetical protein